MSASISTNIRCLIPGCNACSPCSLIHRAHRRRTEVLACNRRSYDQGVQIEDPVRLQALVEEKRAARQHRGADRLATAAPASQILLLRAAERGDNLGTITGALLRLLDRYGAAELDA